MKNFNLLTSSELPVGFCYPPEFERIIRMGILELEPWFILNGEQLKQCFISLTKQYPHRKLIPFARRQDNDDIACWDIAYSNSVFVIHEFASIEWEERDKFNTFYDWFKSAVIDFIEFDT